MSEEVPVKEAADLILEGVDGAVEEALRDVGDRLRQQARDEALAAVLGSHHYAVGAEIARRLDFPEAHVHELISVVSEVNGADPYLAWESAFGFDLRAL